MLLAVLLLACGPAVAGVKVVVEGLSGAELANVEARLGILKYADADDTDDVEPAQNEANIRRLHRRAPQDIAQALQAYGYYSPRVRSSLEGAAAGVNEKPSRPPGRGHCEDQKGPGTRTGCSALALGAAPSFRARYQIEPGPPTVLDKVQVEVTGAGQDFPALYEAIARQPLREGQRLQHAQYENLKAELARIAYHNGFLDAVFTTHTLRVDAAQRRAEVRLVLDTGPRYYFGEVRIEQEKLDDEFLRHYITIQPGEPFDPRKLLEAQFALSDLGYFGNVEVQPMRDAMQDGQRIPVRIALTPRPPRRYDIGAGYGTDTGARVTLGVEFRRLTESGHTLRTDLRFSEVKNSLGAEYRIPLGNEAAERLGFAGAYTDEKFGDGESRRYSLGVNLTRTPGNWQRRQYLEFQYEESLFETAGISTSTLLIPGVSLSRGESDDPIHTRLGWYLFLDAHGAYDDALSDNSFLQLRAQARAVMPLGQRARLLGRAELGASLVDEFSQLPASQRFFAGGDQSVRGYSYRSLGPRNAAGAVIGGEFLNTYSLEAEYRVWGNWGAAAFFDLGNADDDPSPHLFAGTGAGVRYRAPIGTLQIDLAHPLEGAERGIRLHLGIRVGL